MLTKYANHEAILDVKTASERLEYEPGEGAMLAKYSKTASEPETQDGYVYVRTRAISSRVNKNNDGWPSEELAKGYKTFIGRPVFVDHNNSDPRRTRGVIVDAKLHVEDEKTSALDPYYSSAPDNHKPPTWVELLIEVDGKTFPKLAEAVKNGDVDATSMGANIEKSICSVCGNEAAVPEDYCKHIKSKGATFEVTADNGEKVQKKAYEDCYGVSFFEDSFVFDPADETALNIGVDDKPSKLAKEAAKTPYGADAGDYCPECGSNNIGWQNKANSAFCNECGWEGYHTELVASPEESKQGGDFDEHEAKTAFFGIPNQNLFNWLSGVGVVAAYGKPYVQALVHRLANGEPADQVFEELDPDLRARIEEAIEAGNLQNLHPYDQAREGSTKIAELDDKEDRELNYEPQSDQVTSPTKVDTLQDDIKCPNCKVDVLEAGADGILTCPTCHYEQPPEGLDNPDLSKAQEIDKDKTLNDDPQGDSVIRATDEDADDSNDFIKPIIDQRPKQTSSKLAGNWEDKGGVLVNGDLRIVASKDGYWVAKGWYTPEAEYIDGPFRTAEEAMTKYAKATNTNVPTGVISEMKWDTKIATNNATEANHALRRVLAGAVETKIGYSGGIHFGTTAAMKTAGLHATVKYPSVPQPLPLPGNDIQHFMAAAQSMEELGLTNPGEVPITVEAPDETLDQILQIIHSGGKSVTGSVQKTAGAIEIPYPGGMGIHNGTSAAFSQAGISATVSAPGAPMPLQLPFTAPNAFVMIKMLESQGFFVEGNPVHVESENPDLAARLIELNSTSQHPVVAANETKTPAKKNVVLPTAQSKGDTPVDEKVLADQLSPVTADRRVIKREETPDGHRTEQIVEETGDLLDGEPADEKKDEKKDEEKVDTNQPRSQKERVDGGEENKPKSEPSDDNRPDFLKNKPAVAAAVSEEGKLLAALAVAEQAVEMGAIDVSKKMAFVGQLEDESLEEIEARRKTLNLIKSAGLTKKVASSRRTASSLPRLGFNEMLAPKGTDLADVPIEALFM